MVKAIENYENNSDAITNDDFRVDAESCQWYCTTNAYAKDAEYPVVVYAHTRYNKNPIYGVYRRRLNYCTMFIILDVGFGFVFDDKIYHPAKGDVVVLKNGDEFATHMGTPYYEHYYEIDFPRYFFNNMTRDNMFSKLFYGYNNKVPNIISTNTAEYEQIVNLMRKIEKLANSDRDNKDMLAWAYIIQIIDIIYTQKYNERAYLDAKYMPPKLNQAIDYINTNFVNIESIDEIASFCNITPTYLSRMFKNILECTPKEYLTKLRISYAEHLLTHGKSIIDACYESGFNNYTYFISKFKSIMGITPSKYMRRK